MVPTEDLRKRLRKLLNEVVGAGQTDGDTNFLDSEIDELLTEADSLQGAASAGWMLKAGMLEGQIESYTTGQESYKLTSLKDRIAHAKDMAKHYRDNDPVKPQGLSLFLNVQRPEV